LFVLLGLPQHLVNDETLLSSNKHEREKQMKKNRHAVVVAMAVAGMLGACSSKTKPIAANTVAVSSDTPNTSASETVSVPADTAANKTSDSLAITSDALSTTAAPSPSDPSATIVPTFASWISTDVGTMDTQVGSVSKAVFAPNGQAVLFSEYSTSCCSDEVAGWYRRADGAWIPIENTHDTFIAGPDGAGSMGGLTAVKWFNGRFIAIGSRGSVLDQPNSSTAATYASTDGATWTVLDEDGEKFANAVGLAEALHGKTLVGAWKTPNGVVLRSTSNGSSWSEIGSYKPTSTDFSVLSFSLLPTIGDQPTRYAIMGSDPNDGAQLITSTDGKTWNETSLPGATATRLLYPVEFAAQSDEIFIYGSAIDSGVDSDNTIPVGWRSADGVTFTQFLVAGCAGTITDVSIINAETAKFVAACDVIQGSEGDVVDSTSEMQMSSDGVAFTKLPAPPPGLGATSTEVIYGPISRDAGVLTIPVSDSRGDGPTAITIWTPQ
jgi:hypothetical protein